MPGRTEGQFWKRTVATWHTRQIFRGAFGTAVASGARHRFRTRRAADVTLIVQNGTLEAFADYDYLVIAPL